jgi:hypothetical protein
MEWWSIGVMVKYSITSTLHYSSTPLLQLVLRRIIKFKKVFVKEKDSLTHTYL